MTAVNLLRLAALATLLTTGLRGQQAAQLSSEDCAGCHDSGPRTGKREPGVPPNFNAAALKASAHAALDCVSCHTDIKAVPHPEKLAPRRLRQLPPRRAEPVFRQRSRHQGGAERPLCSRLQALSRHARHPAPFQPEVTGRHHQRSRPLRRLPPRRRRSQQDPQHLADQYLGELPRQHSRYRPLPEGPHRHRGLHQLPYRAQRPAAHRSALPPSPNRTSPKPAPGATRKSNPCTAR